MNSAGDQDHSSRMPARARPRRNDISRLGQELSHPLPANIILLDQLRGAERLRERHGETSVFQFGQIRKDEHLSSCEDTYV